MERLAAIVLSTSHVRFEDIKRMESDSSDSDATLQAFNGYYGVCLTVPREGTIAAEATERTYSESVMKLFRFARDNGAGLVILDRDGEELDDSGLDVHEW